MMAWVDSPELRQHDMIYGANIFCAKVDGKVARIGAARQGSTYQMDVEVLSGISQVRCRMLLYEKLEK